MLEKLIQEGHTLEIYAEQSMATKYFQSVMFEKWSTKVVVYFVTNHSESVVTNKLKTKFENLNTNNNYDFYLFAQGALEAMVEVEEITV